MATGVVSGYPSRQLYNEVRVQSRAITKSSICLPTSMLPQALPTSDVRIEKMIG